MQQIEIAKKYTCDELFCKTDTQQYNLSLIGRISKIVEKYRWQITIILIYKRNVGLYNVALCYRVDYDRGFLCFFECLRENAIAKWRVRKLSLTLSIYPERLVYRVAFSFFSRGIRSLRNEKRVAREPH